MIETSAERSTGIINTGWLRIHDIVVVLLLACSLSALAQQSDASGDWAGPTSAPRVDRKDASTGARWDHDVANASAATASVAKVNVSVDASKPRNIIGYRAFGIHTSVYDSNLISPQVVTLLKAAAINTLRYPGGGYADNYHWSTYKPTKWQAEEPPKYGFYAPNNDFGNFAMLLDYVQNGTAVITVNYGSNLAGTGAGEPAEAAAWVAYCNGDPSDEKVIGKDSTGYDWKTVGYWATMRASPLLREDDGFNLLRIGHPKPLNIKYWEIGNEVFSNGYYADDLNGGHEEDLHAPYSVIAKDSDKIRHGNAALSPTAYGKGVAAFSKAMKAIDPSIKVGAVLFNPYLDKKAAEWNPAVMAECGTVLDFVTLHWYTGGLLPPDWRTLDEASLLRAPQEELPKIGSGLVELFHKYAGENASKMQFIVSETGPRPNAKVTTPLTVGLFAADTYASLMEMGAANIDWLEMHANYFLDDKNVQGPAYYGIQMVHLLANINDQLVEAKSSAGLLTVHAAKRADGSLAVMLINKSPKEKSTVKLQVAGAKLAAEGFRFDWGQNSPTDKYPVTREPITGIGNSFSVVVPPYTITNIVIPALSVK
jgi:alpha-L-arabinofuranosidase